jgi:hypothetical protein
VFATEADGLAAQRELYLDRYGAMTVREAMTHLSPAYQNNLPAYYAFLERNGIHLDATVTSQVDTFMDAVRRYEGVETGFVINRSP